MNSIDLDRTKEQIIAHIKEKGPSLPAVIASSLRVQPLFISAFLSELYREEKVLMSHLKVGTSSLYLLSGQEKQLENFIQHLNAREREAFHLVKQKKVVKESDMTPAVRVAVKDIKDFARPESNGTETQWVYIFAEPEEQKVVHHPLPAQIPQPRASEVVVIAQPTFTVQENKALVPEKVKKVREKKVSSVSDSSFALSLSHAQSIPTTPFAEDAKIFLERVGYTNISVMKADKKEATLKAIIQGPNSQQTYLVFAKDKKKLKEEELQAALQEAHAQRLLCLVLARGEPDKKMSQFLSIWGNFLSYREF